MQGLFLRRVHPEPAPEAVTVTVSGTGSSAYCHLTMPDGTKVTAAGTHELMTGDTVVCFTDNSTTFGEWGVYLNGSKAAEAGTAYSYVVTKPASIALKYTKSGVMETATIHITEE